MAIKGLKSVYEDCFAIGAAVSPSVIASHRELLCQHYNSLTAENDMKFEPIHPEEHTYAFEAADAIVGFAEQSGMRVRGHTLVWHQQTPGWVFLAPNGEKASREQVLERMRAHIHTVVGRYRGRVYAWDVVNEAVADRGPDRLRSTPWLETIGEDYIAKAFEFAHEADPDALLFYNDYNESDPRKRDAICVLIRSLLEKGIPIHGVGLQAHWHLTTPTLEQMRAALEAYAGLGLVVQFTEMDISFFDWDDLRTDLVQPPADMLQQQVERYDQIFRLLREYKDLVSGVTFWGPADDHTWLDEFPVPGRKNWPHVFDEHRQPKPSFWRITDF